MDVFTRPLRGVKSGEMTQMECGDQYCSLSHDRVSKFTEGSGRTHERSSNNNPSPRKLLRLCLECARITFTGHVVLAGCGEASAAMAVDGCYPELVPALRSQVWQNHIL